MGNWDRRWDASMVIVKKTMSQSEWDIGVVVIDSGSTDGTRERAEGLGATILPGLAETICADFYMTPEDFESRYLSPAGAGFSIAPHFSQSAWFRFHNRGEGPRNLYLVGAGSHPGAGLPGVLSSAKVVDRLLPSAAEDLAGIRAEALPA